MQWGLRSLPVRLMLAFAGLAIASISAVTYLSVNRERQAFQSHLQQQADLLLESLEATASNSYEQEDIDAWYRMIRAYMVSESPTSLKGTIYAPNGETLAQTSEHSAQIPIGLEVLPTGTPVYIWNAEHLTAIRKTTRDRTQLGAVAVELSTERLEDDIETAWLNALNVAFGASTISTLLALLLGRTITGPLGRMVKVTEQIAAGDFSQRLPHRGGGSELSVLAGSFNDMATQLQDLIARKGAILKYAPDPIVTFDAAGCIVDFNPAAEQVFGCSSEAALGRSLARLVLPSPWKEQLEADIERGIGGNSRQFLDRRTELPAIRADGSQFLVEMAISLMTVRETPLYTATFRDMTERRQAEAALQESEARFRQIFHNAPIGIATIAARNQKILQVNPTWCQILGYTPSESMQLTLSDVAAPVRAGDRQLAEATHFAIAGENLQQEWRLVRRDGQEIWALVTLTDLPAADGEPPVSLAMLEDITQRKQVEAKLRHDAFHDALTGLPNRTLLLARLERAYTRYCQYGEGHAFALLFVDCDRFKAINDNLGHDTGDRLLVALARRLEACVREGDTVARLGGDEFTILLEHVRELDEGSRVAERILGEIDSPFQIGEHLIHTSVSVGVLPSRNGYTSAEAILRDADRAMYRAKSLGRDQYAVFDASFEVRAASLDSETLESRPLS
ncbi:diguanylate cyclase domain-containing protein [Synechococcus sp. PCC 7336]|uniref:diguanylate cyclase domain-containing protein n=1 Tax=Synechococcus sp. PCC 7336 TaxID=195250 RepID=UPI0003464B1C|nr:diguanylate cyclase [Synechococcus sp. PCC 7336]